MAGTSGYRDGASPTDHLEAERRRRAERFAEQLAIRDRQMAIRELHYAALVERHASLEADLDREVARVAALEESVALQREWIAARDDGLASRDAELASLRAQLEMIRATRVWRLATVWWRWRAGR